MPNPKRKHTASRRDSRRAANWKIEAPSVNKCSNCGAAKMPHRICPSCGFYAGKMIVAKKTKKKEEGAEGKQ